MTLGARAVVEREDGRVLLVRHTYTPGLLFPGGGVEHGETILHSLYRELEEEGGLRVTREPTLIGIFSNHKIMRNDHVALYRVESGTWTSFRDPIGREISELVWCDPHAPPQDATPGTKRRLAEIYHSTDQDLHW
jgi:8-oxo-dGTP pyrophosphatase MutT (NUDIX family)